MKALVFRTFGGPDVLQYCDHPDPVLGLGEVLVRTRAIGLNFADIYRRKGNYHLAGNPPWIAGYEAAGEVVAVNGDLPLVPGDRVAFTDSPYANAELVAVPFEKIIPLPAAISCEMAAAALLQGLTAQFLVRDAHPLKPEDRVLVHAASGGVGTLLLQLIRRQGAKAIGLVSKEWKRSLALAAGATVVLSYTEDWVEQSKDFGVNVIYDSVGSTLPQSLEAVRTGGQVVLFGMAGGTPPLVDPRLLMDGSKTITGGDLWNVLTDRTTRLQRSSELFQWIEDGSLKINVGARVALAQGAEAHRLLESGSQTGKILLIP
jgi:NADPH2:quinone reductase